MQIILMTLLFVACTNANVLLRLRRDNELASQCAAATYCQTNPSCTINQANSQTVSNSGNTNTNPGLLGVLSGIGLLNGTPVNVPINVNLCPDLSLCQLCAVLNSPIL